jgi:hypothetical protein
VQGTSHFFLEGDWTKTQEDHILQVRIRFMSTFAEGGGSRCMLNTCTVFRDGVSEGQFYQVLLYELDAIRKVNFI